MKLVDHFASFLSETVNLNDTRVKDLDSSIDAIKSAVTSSNWAPKILRWVPQGSWAHQTIIKPVDQGEFDADLLTFIDPIEKWNAADFLDSLYDSLRENGTYKDKLKRWSHCVTITYANDKKIDVAPCIVNRKNIGSFEVCNRDSNQFELTEPEKYTDWLIEKNQISKENSFRKATRLIKYLRDIKTRFTCSSVLLTTILGYQVFDSDRNGIELVDVPTTLKVLFGRMDNWLQENAIKPKVLNPFLASEDFAASLGDDQYTNFRQKIHDYREWIDDAFDEPDRNESIAKWRRVFGDEFAASVDLDEGRSVSKSILGGIKARLVEAKSFTGDLVEAVKQFGPSVLPRTFNSRPYMKAPTWRRAASMVACNVSATLHNSRGAPTLRTVAPLEPLHSGFWLRFIASSVTGSPFSENEFEIQWRVTNTDEEAWQAKALRGGYYKSDSGNVRWEQLSYRGIHLVEAYIIRRRDQRWIGKSEPFRVMIE